MAMDESLVFRKTGLGAAELTATHGTLSPAARRVLILLDGRRTVAELAELFGLEAVERAVPELETAGFARPIDPDREGADVLTEIYPGLVGEATGPAPAVERRVGLPIGWIVLSATLAIGTVLWVMNRPGSPISRAAAPDQGSPAAPPIEVDRALASAGPSDAEAAERPHVVTEQPLSGLPPIVVQRTAAPIARPRAAPPAPNHRPTERADSPEASSGAEAKSACNF